MYAPPPILGHENASQGPKRGAGGLYTCIWGPAWQKLSCPTLSMFLGAAGSGVYNISPPIRISLGKAFTKPISYVFLLLLL